jgi:hypothetical protein
VTVKVTVLAGDQPAELAHMSEKAKVPAAGIENVKAPLVASVPLQPELPEAAQLVASTDDQVIVVEVPAAMEFSASVSLGAAGPAAVVAVLLALLPPPPQAATKPHASTATACRSPRANMSQTP